MLGLWERKCWTGGEMMAAAAQPRNWEEATCAKHGTQYVRHFLPGFEVWTGRCSECVAVEKLEERGREILKGKCAEIRREVEKRNAKQEKAIQRQTDAELAEYAASVRSEFENDVRRRVWDRLQGEVEAEMLAEIVASLRKGA